MTKKALMAILACIVSACGAGHSPELDRSPSLMGVDRDKNGIRDDIDEYVSTLAVTNRQKLAIQRAASSLQAIQGIDLNNALSVQESANNLAQSVVCLSASFDSLADANMHLKTLENYTANTKNRAEQYNNFNAERDGSVTRLPNVAGCQ